MALWTWMPASRGQPIALLQATSRHTRTRSSRRARSRIRFLAQPKKASASLYRTGLPVQKHRGSRYGTGTVICVNISNPIAKGSVESGCIHTAPRVNSRLYRNVAAMPCFARGRRPDVRPQRARPHAAARPNTRAILGLYQWPSRTIRATWLCGCTFACLRTTPPCHK